MIELVTTAMIARRVGTSASVVSNWKKRYDDFPEPAERNNRNEGRYDWEEVQNFLEIHHLPNEQYMGRRMNRRWELWKNDTRIGLFESQRRARIHLIAELVKWHFLTSQDTFLKAADKVLASGTFEDIEINGMTFVIKIQRKRLPRRGSLVHDSNTN